MADNMSLWLSVEKTDPAFTKSVTERGRKYTDIDPMWLIMQATKQWGPYGSTWGLKNIKREFLPHHSDPLAATHTNRYCILSAVFYYPSGEFEIGNAMPLFSAKQGLYDNDFVKKIETNTLSKALSKLGFGADVFLGKFDDVRYVETVGAEFAGTQREPQNATLRAVLDEAIARGATTAEKLMAAYKISSLDDLPNEQLKQTVQILVKRMAKTEAKAAPPEPAKEREPGSDDDV